MTAAVGPSLEAARAESAARVWRDGDGLSDSPRVRNTSAFLDYDGRNLVSGYARQLYERIESAVCVQVAAAVADILDLEQNIT